MVTVLIRYVIDPRKVADFERYGRRWIELVRGYGAQHHGYFLPAEGANNIAYSLFTFPSLAEYETYRVHARTDPDCQAAYADAAATGCVMSLERTFLRPVF